MTYELSYIYSYYQYHSPRSNINLQNCTAYEKENRKGM